MEHKCREEVEVEDPPGRCVWGGGQIPTWKVARSRTHLEGGEAEDSPGMWRGQGLTWKVTRPKTHLEGGEVEDSPGRYEAEGSPRNLRD